LSEYLVAFRSPSYGFAPSLRLVFEQKLGDESENGHNPAGFWRLEDAGLGKAKSGVPFIMRSGLAAFNYVHLRYQGE
jgi:hypothetical protein